MTGEQRAQLVKALVAAFTLDQLNMVVRRVLNNSLEYYSTGRDAQTVTDGLIDALEREGAALLKFLLFLRETSTRVKLRAAIEDALGIASDANPYQALVVFQEPFVNRRMLRDRLQQLFGGGNSRTLN